MQKIRKKYIFIIFALCPISIAEKTALDQMVNDEKNELRFYLVFPQERREKDEKELEANLKMIKERAKQLK